MAPTMATPGTWRASPWIARVADRATGRARGRRRSCAGARRTSEAARRAVLRARLTRAASAGSRARRRSALVSSSCLVAALLRRGGVCCLWFCLCRVLRPVVGVAFLAACLLFVGFFCFLSLFSFFWFFASGALPCFIRANLG